MTSNGQEDLIAAAGRDRAADATVRTLAYVGSSLRSAVAPFLPFAGGYGVNGSSGSFGY